MIARARKWLLIAVLVAPMPMQGQDVSQRPLPRPASALPVAVSPTVKPLPRPSAEPAPAITVAIAPSVKPLPRPVTFAANQPSPALAAARAVSATTPRPKARPNVPPAAADTAGFAAGVTLQTAASAPSSVGLTRSPFPAPRPKALVEAVAAASAAPAQSQDDASPTPPKPNFIQLLFGAGTGAKLPKGEAGQELASAAPAPIAPTTSAPRKGSVCGDRAIRGEKIKPITSSVNGCGVADPVRVTEVAGITLTQAVIVECDTVIALKDWIDSAMRPAFGGRDVVQLRIAAHYACRGRNNKRGARISEHGKGKALDISGFIFDDGTEWTISRDYNKQIRKAHQEACGIFGTTLGPGSDGYHEDHLHFDTASYRSGTYCR
jgi:hypothetical protein